MITFFKLVAFLALLLASGAWLLFMLALWMHSNGVW